MRSRTTLLWLNRLLWTVLVGIVLALGIVVSLGRYYLPYVESHQREVIDALNRRSGLRFSVGHLRGYWQHLSPHFVVDDLRLYNPEHPEQVVLQIDHAALRIGLFRSINSATLAISNFDGSGLQVALDEAPLGHWHLRGFAESHNAGFDAVLRMLLAIYRADLRDSTIDLRFFGGGATQLQGETLSLQRADNFRRVNLKLTVADAPAPIRAVVEANGDPRDADTFRARGYTTFAGIDLTPLLPAAKAFGFDLKQGGRIDGAAWLDWQPGGAIEVRGHAAMPVLDLAGLSGRAIAPVKNIRTEFLIRDSEGRRQLWLPVLRGEWGGTALNFEQLQFLEESSNPDRFQLALPALNVVALRAALLASDALPDGLRRTLSELAPTGELHQLQLILPASPESRDVFRLRAQLAEVGLNPWQGAPGASGVTGYVDMGLREGHVDLAADHLSMAFPHVYRAPLLFGQTRGQVGWRVEADRVLVESGPIQADSDAGQARVTVALDLPFEGGTPLMTLMVGLRNSGAQYRDRYIPYTVQPALLDWLGRAVGGGKIPVGGFIYRGSLIASQHYDYTVQLFLDVRDGELTYQPEWPPLHDLQAAVWVDDADLLVQSPHARSLDGIVASDVSVEMHTIDGHSWLTVQGDVDGDDDDVLRLLRTSPLHKHLGDVLDSWHWRGQARSRLDLGVAIGGDRHMEVQVDTDLDGQLTLGEQGIVLSNVRGPLQYRSSGGLRSPAIAATWYGKPLIAKVATDDKGESQIDVAGRIAMADLQNWLQQPLFAYAEGETQFQAALHIAGDHSALQVRSDLQGVELRLPAPYSKAAGETLPLTLAMPLAGQRHLLVELGDWADLRLQWDDDHTLRGGVLRLGQSGATTISVGKLIVTGTVPPLELDPWRAALAPFRAGGDDAMSPSVLAVQLRELKTTQLAIAGQTLRDVTVSGQRETEGWALQARADKTAGTLLFADAAEQPWRIHLDYLHLPAPTPGAASSLENIDPTQATPVDLRIDHLWRGDEEWGWVQLQLRPVAHGLRLQQLEGELRGIHIEPRGEEPASLTWLRQDGIDSSQLNARLTVADIGESMQRFHFEKAMTSKRGQLDAQLSWRGRPDEAKLTRVDGNVQMEVDDGRFLKASGSTAGALKVVGIFNFANLLKRLQLDFSDVFKDGVSFDAMKGGVALQQGVVTTVEPIEIKSPSSRFRMGGKIDFNTDQTDMELVATLPVASNLPWVAALAAGLPAAAGVYVASKIFENQVDKFGSAAYDIRGPWHDPQVKFRRVFDDKLSPKTPSGSAIKEIAAPAPGR